MPALVSRLSRVLGGVDDAVCFFLLNMYHLGDNLELYHHNNATSTYRHVALKLGTLGLATRGLRGYQTLTLTSCNAGIHARQLSFVMLTPLVLCFCRHVPFCAVQALGCPLPVGWRYSKPCSWPVASWPFPSAANRQPARQPAAPAAAPQLPSSISPWPPSPPPQSSASAGPPSPLCSQARSP